MNNTEISKFKNAVRLKLGIAEKKPKQLWAIVAGNNLCQTAPNSKLAPTISSDRALIDDVRKRWGPMNTYEVVPVEQVTRDLHGSVPTALKLGYITQEEADYVNEILEKGKK